MSTVASASVILHGTRLIYPGESRDKSIVAENNGTFPVLVQAWIDDGDDTASVGNTRVPFALTPPLFKLNPSNTQSLRVIYDHSPLPADRESLFWLNVLEIPPNAQTPSSTGNQLRMTFRSRIKMFYRPPGLSSDQRAAGRAIKWSLQRDSGQIWSLIAENPSPYYVTFSAIDAKINNANQKVTADMVEPFGRLVFKLPRPLSGNPVLNDVEYSFIDDYGALISVDKETKLGR